MISLRLDSVGVQTVLMALGEQLTIRTDSDIAIVVCGGSALAALGLVRRTTRDVDILALAQRGDGELLLRTAEPLPATLLEAATVVGQDFGLPENWLNAGPTDLLRDGLPEGCASRLHTFSYGERLTVHFIDRFDQICLKTYAAINGDAPRHLADLRALAPTDGEMLAASRWTVTQDAADFYTEYVSDFLRKIGHPDVADRL